MAQKELSVILLLSPLLTQLLRLAEVYLHSALIQHQVLCRFDCLSCLSIFETNEANTSTLYYFRASDLPKLAKKVIELFFSYEGVHIPHI